MIPKKVIDEIQFSNRIFRIANLHFAIKVMAVPLSFVVNVEQNNFFKLQCNQLKIFRVVGKTKVKIPIRLNFYVN